MIGKIWQSIKMHVGWVYLGAFLAIAAWEYSQGDAWYEVAIDVFLGVVLLWAYQFSSFWRPRYASGGCCPPPRTFEEGEVKMVLDKPSALPQPPEHAWNEKADDCPACQQIERERPW